MAPRSAEATPAMRKPMTSVGTAPSRAMKSEPGSAAIANRTIGRPERMPTSVPDRRRSDWIDKMTGGTARMLSRRPTPASQSRPAATQNSRMALPAAAFAVLLRIPCSRGEDPSRAIDPVPSPLAGEGARASAAQRGRVRGCLHPCAVANTPHPARLPPLRFGRLAILSRTELGPARVRHFKWPKSDLSDFGWERVAECSARARCNRSRRALEARERFVDLEAARLGFFALLALAFDHVLRRAGDEVGIGELGVDAGDVGFNARHFLLEARFLGGEVDHPLER